MKRSEPRRNRNNAALIAAAAILAASAWVGRWQYVQSAGKMWMAVIAGGCVLIALTVVAVGMFDKRGGGK